MWAGSIYAVGLNFGVEIAWVLVSWCTLILFQYIKRRQAIHAHEAANVADAARSSLDKAGP